MPVSFLNEAERDRLNRFPGQISDKNLVMFFALSASDKAQIRKQRGSGRLTSGRFVGIFGYVYGYLMFEVSL